jgi:hypothetical protein
MIEPYGITSFAEAVFLDLQSHCCRVLVGLQQFRQVGLAAGP